MTKLASVANAPQLTPETFINRELSTIDFQRRVLALAQDDDTPLLERVKFIAIVGNNLDEFFMVRIASTIQKIQLGSTRARPDGYTPQQLMPAIREQVETLIREQRATLRDVLAQLADENVKILAIDELTETQRRAVRAYFNETIYPVLTPLAVDHARPFPFISNLSLNLGVYLQRDNAPGLEFARIKVPVPDILPRLVNLNEVLPAYGGDEVAGHRFIWVEDLIRDNLDMLFPGMTIEEAVPFRVLRNADIDYEHEQEDELLDVRSIIEQSVRERRFGSVVRLSVPQWISERMLNRLREGLNIRSERDVYLLEGALGSANLFELAGVDRPDLKYDPYVPRRPEVLPTSAEVNLFDVLRQQDIVVHHPYDSFGPVEEFFDTAAHDPAVLAIKATLYRVGKNSPVVKALMEARDNEKQVTVLVELKARFDEENNLEWARALEAKGVHVIYGVEELPVKTHSKIALVVRREADGVRRYLHLGTGNYNASTARLYTDIGVLTGNEALANDATRLFNRLTGYAPATDYQRLMVAPEYLIHHIIELMDNEIAAAKAGKPAQLLFKMNQLEEDNVIRKLYEASQAGVHIELVVRGFCCLRPGVPGISDNIHVTSILGRFLEHSRIYYFHNAPEDKKVLVGSADLMRRNLHNRVETVFPVLDPHVRERVLRILMTNLRDNDSAWALQADGSYIKCAPQDQEERINAQSIFMDDSYGLHVLPA